MVEVDPKFYFEVSPKKNLRLLGPAISEAILNHRYDLPSLPKTIDFSFNPSNVAVNIVRVRINAIKFIFFEADVRTFQIRITA